MEDGKKIFGIKEEYFIIGILILIILPFLILNYFNHPAPENFYWTEEVKKFGFSKVYWSIYKYVMGRYFTSVLVTLNPLFFFSIAGYKVYTLLLMIAFFYVVYLFVNEMASTILTSRERFLFSVSIIFLYLYGMASVREGFYWDIGAIHYHLSLIFIMLFSIFYIRFSNENNFIKKIFYIFICCLLVLVIPGTCELGAILILILIFSVIIKNFFIEKRINWLFILFALLTVICVYISYSAPGNHKRIEWTSESRNFSSSTYNSFTFLIENLFIWIFNTPILVVTLLFIPVFFKAAKGIGSHNEIFSVNPIYSLMLCFILLYTNIFIVIWGQGGLPYDRTVNFIYFVFLVGWFYNAFILSIYIYKRYKIGVVKLPKYSYAIAFIIIVFFLFRGNNITNAYADLLEGTACKYNNELNERYNFILQSTSDSIEVEAIMNVPKSFYSRDLIDDTSVWFEEAFAHYYNKKSIVIKKSNNK